MTQEMPVFKSSLTMDEIEQNFEGMDVFTEIMEGLEEALEHSTGEKCHGREDHY